MCHCHFSCAFLELFTSVSYFSFYGTCFSFLEFLTKSIPGHLFLTFYIAVNSFLIFSLPTRGHIQTRKWIKTGKNNYKCQILSYGRQNVNNKCIKKQPCVRIRVYTRLKRLCDSFCCWGTHYIDEINWVVYGFCSTWRFLYPFVLFILTTFSVT